MTSNPADVEGIFFLAKQKEPQEWAAYLDEVCGGDVALRQRIEQLLGAQAELGTFLERPASAVAARVEEARLREGPGTFIGPYRLLEQIGEGGFGVVFLAEQEQPLRRKVALKVVKPGMDTQQVVARFEAERQALALMAHPNIAHVFDGGQTASGRPYFVMELVRGVPLTAFCDTNRLPIPERLELFISVCQAVQHAHQKGIIHRDLKPANILVALDDVTPVVKVIDFGIAKATGQRLTDKTPFTHFAQLMGTPQYMSPEQAEMNRLDIDTRTDIYSLGVLLYELLTGTTPFDRERLRTAAFDEALRVIREEEPAKPSTRISKLGQTGASVSLNRGSDPRRLSQVCGRELDWIVMKALEKDRNRRYATANSLGNDVQRYLRDESVEACPPSAWYRFRKFVRRNRGTFLAGLAIMLVLLLAVAGLAISNIVIRQEQARTQEENLRAEKAQRLAEMRAEEVRQGMERLKAANALVEEARLYHNWQFWADAHAALTRAIALRPDHAPAWDDRGHLYAHLTLWELAAADMGKAYELQEPALTWRWYCLALVRAYLGDTAGSRAVSARMYERFHGASNRKFVEEMVRGCALLPGPPCDPARLVELATVIVEEEPRHSIHLYVLGLAHYRAGQYDQAVRRLNESLEVGSSFSRAGQYDPWLGRLSNYPLLAMAHHRAGRPAEAREALSEAEQTLDRWSEAVSRPHPGPWPTHHNIAGALPAAWWDMLDFQLFYREARALMDLPPPPDDPRLRVARARAFACLGWPDKAVAEDAEAAKRRPDDKQILRETHRCRGLDHLAKCQWAQAASEFSRASALNPDEPYYWWFQALAHASAGDGDAYRRVCSAMLQRFGKTQGTWPAHETMAACVLRDGAVSDWDRLIALGKLAARRYPGATRVYAAALVRAGRHEEALEGYQVVARISRYRAEDWLFQAMAHHHLGHSEEAQRCLARGAAWIQEAGSREGADLVGTLPAWRDWQERLVAPLLLREAEALIPGTKP